MRRSAEGTEAELSNDLDSRPSLGVVVTSVNRPEYLKQLLQSLDRQSSRQFGVLLINNGGTTETTSVMEQWANETPLNVEVQVHLDNVPLRHISAAHNFDYVLMPGDDDILARQAVEVINGDLASTDGYSLLGYPASSMSSNGWRLPKTYRPCSSVSSVEEEKIVGRLLADACFPFPSTVYRVECLANAAFSYQKYDYVGDWLMSLTAATQGKIFRGNESIVRLRRHQNAGTHYAKDARVEEQRLQMLSEFLSSEEFRSYVRSLSESQYMAVTREYLEYVVSQRSVRYRDVVVLRALSSTTTSKEEPLQAGGNRSPEEALLSAREATEEQLVVSLDALVVGRTPKRVDVLTHLKLSSRDLAEAFRDSLKRILRHQVGSQ